ncbi:hypothetical protein [Lutibaculum baratangense]|uniref:Uncharacterized protein n=1 Tax=Lutibaculum baratangense AMV1 TaxID=631454 RepID=V4TC59_9HYPH|nr:hypothetical protein [Lutibaculum baratangense]ESR23908.1 hypothetical protein N177_2853 [Lutibaculum baratangense AMV1]
MAEEGIQGVLIEELQGVTHLPDGKVAVIVRNAGQQIGLVFEPEDASELGDLLSSAAAEGDAGPNGSDASD